MSGNFRMEIHTWNLKRGPPVSQVEFQLWSSIKSSLHAVFCVYKVFIDRQKHKLLTKTDCLTPAVRMRTVGYIYM